MNRSRQIKHISFSAFILEVSQLLQHRYALTLDDATDEGLLRSSYEEGESSFELVDYVGRKFDLVRVDSICAMKGWRRLMMVWARGARADFYEK